MGWVQKGLPEVIEPEAKEFRLPARPHLDTYMEEGSCGDERLSCLESRVGFSAVTLSRRERLSRGYNSREKVEETENSGAAVALHVPSVTYK